MSAIPLRGRATGGWLRRLAGAIPPGTAPGRASIAARKGVQAQGRKSCIPTSR